MKTTEILQCAFFFLMGVAGMSVLLYFQYN